ncbi:MAG TPA: hypothetical protein DCY47_13245, partial [Candidatus Accumulibacter sp.]|nr:hypothetical protein [Accumulibacter sp.]
MVVMIRSAGVVQQVVSCGRGAMRMTLRALAGLCLAVVTTVVTPSGTVYAGEQAKGKAAPAKGKESVAARAGAPKPVAQKARPA